MADKADIEFMRQALGLALKGSGKTSPNPMVGAVIAKDGKIIAEGYHARAGAAHAEIVALKKAGHHARGATLYVTLEPCCHTGRTGPCTEAIIKAGIARVVYAMKDPDPRVSGRGGARLRRAGVNVTSGVLRYQAQQLNEKYVGFLSNGRPFVTLKTAQTIDGRIATVTGDSQWVSGPQSLKFAHQLRAEHDAVLVGMGTVKADNPSLTVRNVRGTNPYRVVLTRSLNFPKPCSLLEQNRDGRTIIATTGEGVRKLTRRRNLSIPVLWELKTDRSGLVDLKDLMNQAAEFGIHSILVEGGGRLATEFLKQNLVDKYVAIIAPKVIGRGIEAVGDLKISKLSEAILFERPVYCASGSDMIFTGYPKHKTGGRKQ